MPTYDKNSQKNRNRGALPQLEKGHPRKPTIDFMLHVEKPEASPLRSGPSQGCSPSLLLIQHNAGNSGQCNTGRKGNKSVIQKGRHKTIQICR